MGKERSNSHQLVNNTLTLYVRMFLTMLIALYTSRVVLKSLGVEDYGLYNVVGGLVALVNVVSNGIAASTRRFLSFELGKKDNSNLHMVFSMCETIHIMFAIVFIILAETIGLWFLNNYIQIPQGREVAANWIFQFSIISVAVHLIAIPYGACTISHEKMGVYAFVGILDAVLKLGIASVILLSSSDRLILYGGLLVVVTVINFLIYLFYCLKFFPESHYRFHWDSGIFKQIFSFSSWTILGQGAQAVSYQGTNILVNMFHSVRANAAMGVASQVNAALTGLTSNFYIAYQPQITKSYSSKNYDYCEKLLYGSSKLSFYLVFIIALPVLFNIDAILDVWLDVVPENTSKFCVFFIISAMVNALGNPFYVGVYATGIIKPLQIITTILYCTNVLLIWVFYKLGFPVYFAPLIKLVIDVFLTSSRIYEANRLLDFFSIKKFLKKNIAPIILSVLPVMVLFIPSFIFIEGLLYRVLFTLIIMPISCLCIMFLGLDKEERRFVVGFIKKYLHLEKGTK